MSHEHHCKHEIGYCEVCDVCYCKKCKKEWGSHSWHWYYSSPYYSPTVYPSVTWTTSTSSSDVSTFGTKCTHNAS